LPTETLDKTPIVADNSDAPSTSTERRESGEVLLRKALDSRREKSRESAEPKPPKEPSEKQPQASAQKPGRSDAEPVAAPTREARAETVQHTGEATVQAEAASDGTDGDDADRVARAEKAAYEKGRSAGNRDWDQMKSRQDKLERDNLTHIETIRRLGEQLKELTQKAYRQGLSFDDIQRLDINETQRGAIEAVGQYYSKREQDAAAEQARQQQYQAISQTQAQERHRIAHEVVQDTVDDLRFAALKLGVEMSKEEAKKRLSGYAEDEEIKNLIALYNAPTTPPDHAKLLAQTIYKKALEAEIGKIQDTVVEKLETTDEKPTEHPRTLPGGAGGADPSPQIPKGQDGSVLISQFFADRRKQR